MSEITLGCTFGSPEGTDTKWQMLGSTSRDFYLIDFQWGLGTSLFKVHNVIWMHSHDWKMLTLKDSEKIKEKKSQNRVQRLDWLQQKNSCREKNVAKETDEQWEVDIHSSWGDWGEQRCKWEFEQQHLEIQKWKWVGIWEEEKTAPIGTNSVNTNAGLRNHKKDVPTSISF